MSTFISQNTDKPMPIVCYFCENERGGRLGEFAGKRVTAVRLRGQWAGGDLDVDPVWKPVCVEHDSLWDVADDAVGTLDRKYQLPSFNLHVWWVVIDRRDLKNRGRVDKDIMRIGPYPDEASAKFAMDESLLVQGELEDPGGEDCYLMEQSGYQHQDTWDTVLIHLDDPTYTGEDS